LQLVLLQEGADLDALSSAYGLSLLYNAKIVLPNAYSETVRLTLNIFSDKFKDKIGYFDKNAEKIYLVDSHYIDDLDSQIYKKIEIYDHHPINEYKKNIKYHIKNYGSATTIIVEKLKRKKVYIDNIDATILALGIYEDTGKFCYNLTTPQDLKMASYLLEKGANLKIISDILTNRLNSDKIQVFEKLLKNSYNLYLDNKTILIASAYISEYISDISSAINLIEEFNDVDALFILLQTKNKITLIGRSSNKEIDLSQILSIFGGGGHWSAASATIKTFSLNQLQDYLEFLLKKYLSDAKKLKDIANPVEITTSLKHSDGIKILINQEGKYEGIVINNKFDDNLIVLDANISLWEAEKEISKYEQDIFPVLEKQKPVGVVSKKDILRALYKLILDKEKIFLAKKEKPKEKNVKDRLKHFLPEDIYKELKIIGKIAKENGYRVYLVGGIVRDFILSKKSLDIDIIVEGDIEKIIKDYAKNRKISVYFFKEFMTATLKLENGIKFDFATARKESYEYPGAYPKVEKATIFEDLYRRDFTINTLAIEITEDRFGTLIDFFDGLKDIKEKRIKVLHQTSFIEDPIRILRALRFAGRFGYKLEKNTEKLLKLAVEEKLLQKAPTGRINLELNLTFDEENVLYILNLMDKYKVLRQIFPNCFMNLEREVIIAKISEAINIYKILFDLKIEKDSNYLMALMYHLPFDVSYFVLKKYHFDKSIKHFKYIFDFVDKFKNLPEKNIEFYKFLKTIPVEILPFSAIYFNFFEKSIEIMKKEKEFKNIISGEDLKNIGIKPSPIYKKILSEIFELYLDGKISSKKDAIDYLKKYYNN